MIKKMIDDLKAWGWVFTVNGANIDVEKVAAQISGSNFISFNQTSEGTQAMFAKESNTCMKFFDRMSKGESMKKLAYKYFDEYHTLYSILIYDPVYIELGYGM